MDETNPFFRQEEPAPERAPGEMDAKGQDNLLLRNATYKVRKTDLGTWNSYLYPSGKLFTEFRSHANYLGLPLIHYTRGICPETGRRRIAKGIVAVGRLAIGFIAVGHASAGFIAVGQAAFGLLFGLGQLCTGVAAIGQLAIAILFAVGQFAFGLVAIGQFAVGKFVLAALGFGQHVWDTRSVSPVAHKFFHSMLP